MLTFKASGQAYVSRHFGVDEGLIENRIYTLFEHSNGLLFVGTGIGLNVFDGENMLEIPSGSYEPVRSILPYKEDSLILVKESSICVLSVNNYRYRETRYYQSTENLLTQGILVNDVLYCSSLKGLVKIDVKTMRYSFLTLGLTNQTGNLYSSIFQTVAYSPLTDCIYYGSRYGFVIYRVKSGTLRKAEVMNRTSCQLLGETSRISHVHHRDGKIYYQVRSGKIHRYDEKTGEILIPDLPGARQVKFADNAIYLPIGDTLFEFNYDFQLLNKVPLEQFQAIADVHKNVRNEYVLATHDGLVVLRKNSEAIRVEELPVSGETGSIELQNKVDFEGLSYLNVKNGLIELDGKKSFSRFFPLPEETLNVIQWITPYKDNKVLVLGSGGYLAFDLRTKKYFSPNLFSDSMEQHIAQNNIITGNYDSITGHILFCPHRNPMIIKDLNSGREWRWSGNDSGWFNTARSLVYAGNYDYFIGSNNTNGVMRYNFLTGKGRHYGKSVFGKIGIIQATVNRLKFFENKLFIATIKGMAILDTSNQTMHRATLNSKIFSDNFFSINVIDNRLYTTSGNALYLYQSNLTFGTIYNFNREKESGVPIGSNDEIHFMNSSNLIHLDLKKLNAIRTISISHLVQGSQFYSVNRKWRITTPYSSENTTLMVGTDLYIKEKVPFKLYYRWSKNQNWIPVRNYRIYLGPLKYGKNEIELYTNQQGNVNRTSVFTIFMKRPWWASYQFYLFCTILGMVVLWMFIRWVIQRRIKKERAEISRVLNSIDQERKRISADFHDGIGPNLSTIKLISESLKTDHPNDPMHQLSELIDETLLSIREVINELSPQYLDENGLELALKQFIHLMERRHPRLKFVLSCKLLKARYAKEIEINVFRFCQEAINNAVKHAKPAEIAISIEESEHSMLISIRDDGTFMPENIHNGLGMNNMKTRAKLLNGEFNILHGQNLNTEVKIVLPLET